MVDCCTVLFFPLLEKGFVVGLDGEMVYVDSTTQLKGVPTLQRHHCRGI